MSLRNILHGAPVPPERLASYLKRADEELMKVTRPERFPGLKSNEFYLSHAIELYKALSPLRMPCTDKKWEGYKRVRNSDAGSLWNVFDQAVMQREQNGVILIYNHTRKEWTRAGDEADLLQDDAAVLEGTIGQFWT